MMFANSHGYSIPAVIAPPGINGLGVARSLAREGVPVVLLDDDLEQASSKTRYGKKYKVKSLEGEDFIESLLSLAATYEDRPVLYLTQEESVKTVSKRQEELARSYRFTMPSEEIMAILLDKNQFSQVATHLGAPVPRTIRLCTHMDSKELYGFQYPAVLKPAYRHSAYGASFRKAYKIETAMAVEALYSEIGSVLEDVILQEWVEGDDSDIFFCLLYIDEKGNPVVSFVGRKIRSWPPQVGGTASCTGAPDSEYELSSLTVDFFKKTGFVGICSMEYKRDRRSGKYFMIEPTVGRTDYQEEVATLNGVNIPMAIYRREVGLPTPTFPRHSPTAVWKNTMCDRWSAQLQNQDPASFPVTAGNVYDALWRWYDPMPGIAHWMQRVTVAVKRRLKPDASFMKKNIGTGK